MGEITAEGTAQSKSKFSQRHAYRNYRHGIGDKTTCGRSVPDSLACGQFDLLSN